MLGVLSLFLPLPLVLILSIPAVRAIPGPRYSAQAIVATWIRPNVLFGTSDMTLIRPVPPGILLDDPSMPMPNGNRPSIIRVREALAAEVRTCWYGREARSLGKRPNPTSSEQML